MSVDVGMAGALLGMHSWEAKRAEDNVKAIQQQAKIALGNNTGVNNPTLKKIYSPNKTAGSGIRKLGNVNSGYNASIMEILKTPRQNTAARATPPSSYKDVSGVSSTNYNPDGPGGRWDVLDIGNFNPTSLTTIPVGNGKNITVNAAVADRFAGFLKDLQATGYGIDSIGGHADRNARGSNRPSMHKYGLAIDINPSRNPMTGALITDMPPNIRDIAAKYDLVWGGDWNGRTKDTMHFSFPYQGGK